jgi:membrane protein
MLVLLHLVFYGLISFALFILNLIPFIPIEVFRKIFCCFKDGVPPNTYDAIYKIISDILNNSDSGLLSSGFYIVYIFDGKWIKRNFRWF